METTFQLNFTDLAAFYGVNNINLQCLKDAYPTVSVLARDKKIKITGEGTTFSEFVETLQWCIRSFEQKHSLSQDEILHFIHPHGKKALAPDFILGYGGNGKSIVAKSRHQVQMAELFETHDLLFATGPAGSGKTYTAIVLSVMALKNKHVKRIILCRPAVEAGERIGFLPGDMKDKVDPFMQPLYDALRDMIDNDKLEDMMKKGIVQILPLAFMRGRTLSDAVVILDEAQNTTPAQLKMFLTRLGVNSKMILTGDLTQIDLPNNQTSGLQDAIQRLASIENIGFVDFDQQDIIRHPIVRHIVKAYNRPI